VSSPTKPSMSLILFMNKSEEYVTSLCKRTFLSLWSYPNPRGKDARKELCDILIICDPDVIIFSVKEVQVKDSGNVSRDWKRWLRRSIDESVKQICGAESWINKSANIVTKDGEITLPIPNVSSRKMHRVAVALGRGEKWPLYFGDFGKGFVHVFDEISLDIVMNELDTITDFVKYLRDIEAFITKDIKITLNGGEEDLLALYLTNGRIFPDKFNSLYLDDNLWKGFIEHPEYQAKKEADKGSYIWDRLIEIISADLQAGNLDVGNSLTDVELTLRIMARENRFSRRVLGKSFLEFMDFAQHKNVRSRICQSPSYLPYVFLACKHEEDRNIRRKELVARCFVARGIYSDQNTVVGIATEKYESGQGFSLDVCLFSQDTWSTEDKNLMESLQTEWGYFRKPNMTYAYEDEYPNPSKIQ
jgi:hypothetical protein